MSVTPEVQEPRFGDRGWSCKRKKRKLDGLEFYIGPMQVRTVGYSPSHLGAIVATASPIASFS